MDKGFIKIHRSILDWEWYSDTNVHRVFFHILLNANFTSKKWRGIEIHRGQFLTSIDAIYNGLNRNPQTGKLTRSASRLTTQSIRTALKRLKSTNEITIQTTSQYTLITVNNYDKYQGSNKRTNKRLTNDQQTTNKRLTTTKELKNVKNVKNVKKKIQKNKFSKIENLTKPVLQEIAETYEVPVDFVEDKLDDLKNYCASKGKTYKDYRATLVNWVKKDKRELLANSRKKPYGAGKTAYYTGE